MKKEGKPIQGIVGLGKGQARHITFYERDIFHLFESSKKKKKKIFPERAAFWAK